MFEGIVLGMAIACALQGAALLVVATIWGAVELVRGGL